MSDVRPNFYWAYPRSHGPRVLKTEKQAARIKSSRRPKYYLLERALYYRCCKCNAIDVWREGWTWFGSYLDLDEQHPVAVFCPDCAPLEAARK